MSAEKMCPIWGVPCEDVGPADSHFRHVNSPRAGGEYEITNWTHSKVNQLNPLERAKLSRWIYEQNQLENIPRIDISVVRDVPNWPKPSVPERLDYLIQFAELETRDEIGMQVECSLKMLAATVAENPNQMDYLIRQAASLGWVEIIRAAEMPIIKEITTKGYQHLENLRGIQSKTDQAFVAMWFDKTMNDAWEKGFEPAIIDAGYKPMRIDRKEHINKIDDEIIAEIRRSRFLVADFTSKLKEPRGGVYYEAGFAHGLNIPVIYTCRENCIDDIHFDTRQFNHLKWETPEDLRTDLAKRISAVLGDGPHRIRKQD